MPFSDDFFKVNPDIKPGTIPSEEGPESAAARSRSIPPSKRDKFKETFEKGGHQKEDRASAAEQQPKPFSLPKTNKEVFENVVEQAKLNPETNQPRTLAKESKVAPPLGSGKLEAPPEEPRAQPHIEPASSAKKKSKHGEQLGAGEMKTPTDAFEKPAKKAALQPPSNALEGDALTSPKTEKVEAASTQSLSSDEAELAETLMRRDPAEAGEALAGEAQLVEAAPAEPKERAVTAKEKHETTKSAFAEHPDGKQAQTYAIPNIETAASHIGEQSIQPQMSSQAARQEMIDLVNQIVDKLTTVTTQDSSEVHITIKNIPLFEGATVKVTTMKQAPGEFNVEFTNLTQQAKEVLDQVGNRALLHDSLEQKGYVLHMITTSTFREEPIATQSSNSGESESDTFGEGDADQEEHEEKKEEEK